VLTDACQSFVACITVQLGFNVGVSVWTTEAAVCGVGGAFKDRFSETTQLTRAVLGGPISAILFDGAWHFLKGRQTDRQADRWMHHELYVSSHPSVTNSLLQAYINTHIDCGGAVCISFHTRCPLTPTHMSSQQTDRQTGCSHAVSRFCLLVGSD